MHLVNQSRKPAPANLREIVPYEGLGTNRSLRHGACVRQQTLLRLNKTRAMLENMEQFFFKKGSSFTHNGDYFALVSVDGRLRIWDTTSGRLVQEFSPSAVTEASCTCLCWLKKKESECKKKTPRKVKIFCIINILARLDKRIWQPTFYSLIF